MNKHVVAMGIMAVAIGFLVDRCSKLEKKLAFKSVECETYKFVSNVYEILLGAKASDKTDDKTEEKEEA